MLVLGSTSDISRAFIEKSLESGEKFNKIYLITTNVEQSNRLAQHLSVKFEQNCQVIEFDILKNTSYNFLDQLNFDLVFCATGYLGLDTQNGIYNQQNTQNIIDVNYAKLVPLLNKIAEILEQKKQGTMIILSSVAGERGRQSNFVYGSAKAAMTTYTSGLRNYLHKKNVHVMTVIPGFMYTKMTQYLSLPKPITATPKQAAESIYKAYKNKKNVVYVLWMWKYIMLIIKYIPESIFKKLSL
jgi:decaprenylphospho-beta-D-erythro-pentofuranosid-2-ulose 2-reductase